MWRNLISGQTSNPSQAWKKIDILKINDSDGGDVTDVCFSEFAFRFLEGE